jgi:hypothetical protein
MDNSRVRRHGDRFAANSGTVSRASLLLTFRWLTFDRWRWIARDGRMACAKGCRFQI